jgi:hypothetical protein
VEEIDFELFASQVLDAVQNRNWFLLAALALSLTVCVVRKPLAARVAFFATKEGGALLNLAFAATGGLITVAASGQSWSWFVGLTVAKIALTAAGGWALFNHLAPLWHRVKAWVFDRLFPVVK